MICAALATLCEHNAIQLALFHRKNVFDWLAPVSEKNVNVVMTSVPARQGVASTRDSDTGPIPEAMVEDLRHLLWTMEKVSLYFAVGMGAILGGILIAGITLFASASIRTESHDIDAIGGLALAVLCAMAYAPFFNRWFEDKLEARWLREALFPRRLEDLSYYMAVCRMGSRKRVADKLLAIWVKYGLEPGWSARPIDPPPLFK